MQTHYIHPDDLLRSKLKLVLFSYLLLSLLACHRNDKPILQLTLNGSLQSINGIKPMNAVSAQYSGFLKQQALQLRPGDMAIYNIAGSDLKIGTLQFWFKIASPLPEFPIRFIQIANEKSSVRIFQHQNAIKLALEQDGNTKAFKSVKHLQTRGNWLLFDLTWDFTNKDTVPFQLYVDGVLQNLESLPNWAQPNSSPNPNRFMIGIPHLQVDSNEVSIDLRDVALWSGTRASSRIREDYDSGQKLMQTSLVWSAANLRHYAGKEIRDDDSKDGVYWTTDTQIGKKEGIILPAKDQYELSFRIKPFTKIADDNLVCHIYYTNKNGEKKELANWKNKSSDLAPVDQFGSHSIQFSASQENPIAFEFHSFIPSKGSMLLDTVSLRRLNGSWQQQWRFEDLQHTMGVWKEDPDASGGKGWINAHTLDYGPYTCIGQPGRYRATWRIRVTSNVPPQTPLLLLDVYAHDGFLGTRQGNKSYGRLALNAAEFQHQNAWEEKSIEFHYDGADMMEFRAFAKTFQPNIFVIDTITVKRLS
jgi:hypothetical protein